MILSTDLNPVLRKRIRVPFRKDYGGALNPEKIEVFPGGEGIELSFMLRIMNEDSIITGFEGGHNGQAVKDFLDGSDIKHIFVEIKESTGEQLYIHFSDGQTFIPELKPRISREETALFIREFKENLNLCEIVCITGSTPQNIPPELLGELVSMTSQWGRKSLVGLKGRQSVQAIQGKPYLIVLDLETLENMTHLKLEYESEIVKAARYVLEKGIEYLIIDLKEKGAVVLCGDRGYKFEFPHFQGHHCNVNYGYMLAGFAVGITRGYNEETVLRLGIAGSVIHSFRHSAEVDMSDVKNMMNRLAVRAFRNI